MAEASPPYWVLISILFSSLPLSPGLAMRLWDIAYELYRTDQASSRVRHELADGEVTNLRKVLAMGSISGPGFEAQLETERGAGTVRFLLTRTGLEMMAEQQPKEAMN